MTGIESERRTLTRPPWLEDDVPASRSDLDVLFASGVPQHFIGRRFRVDDEVAMVHAEGGAVLRFGTTGQSAAVGVGMDTGWNRWSRASSPRAHPLGRLSAPAPSLRWNA